MDPQITHRITIFLVKKLIHVPAFLWTFRRQLKCEVANEHYYGTTGFEFGSCYPILSRYGSEVMGLSGDELENLIVEYNIRPDLPQADICKFQTWYFRNYVSKEYYRKCRGEYAACLMHRFFWL